jgi:CRP-like cAMP-binding protein
VTTVTLIDADADLADAVGVGSRDHARTALIARTLEVPSGRWNPLEVGDAGALLVIEGALLREVDACDAAALELLGPGDLIVPTADNGDDGFVDVQVSWSAVLDSRMAVLGATLVQRLSDWPGVLEVLVRRMAERSNRQAVMQAVCNNPRVDVRLRGLFWHLADRWGRVTPGGIVLPLRLTHDALARLVGAQRPTVSTALKSLERAGEVTRRRDGAWVLLPESEERLHRLRDRAAEAPLAVALLEVHGGANETTRARLERLSRAWEEQSAWMMALRKRSAALRAQSRELSRGVQRSRLEREDGGASSEP